MGLLDIIMARGDGAILRGQAEALVQAPADRVYWLLADVTRMKEWSPECYRCEWLDGAVVATPGARFKGYNRRGWRRWSVLCTVTEAEPGRVFAFETRPFGRDVQTRWRYELEETDSGTILRESFQVFWYFRFVALTFGGRRRRQAQLEEGVRQTLERMKAYAESD